jgi:hypothetical protein
MSSRTEAFAGYLKEIYRDYDALLENDHLITELRLSTLEVQPEQIISLSENFDIEDLVFLVLMEASQDAQDDLRDLLEDMRAATQAKHRLRTTAAKLRQRLEDAEQQERDEYHQRDERDRDFARLDFEMITQALLIVAAHQSDYQVQALADDLLLTRRRIRRAGTDDPVDPAKDQLDSLTELSEMESLRLQMALDRRSKFIEALSNVMKKMSDTNDAIIENLK